LLVDSVENILCCFTSITGLDIYLFIADVIIQTLSHCTQVSLCGVLRSFIIV